MDLPVLYTFRRCPYAMRTRMALAHAGIGFEVREVLLRDKPQALLALSPKGTVPVLQTDTGVIEESLEIMQWALARNSNAATDPWLAFDPPVVQQMFDLVAECDGDFKASLDRYKYADRYPDNTPEHYRHQGEGFLQRLENLLAAGQPYLFGVQPGFADVALMPFIRQFAHVDKAWFDQAPYPQLRQWLQRWLASPLFLGVMSKYARWQPGQPRVVFAPATDIAVS